MISVGMIETDTNRRDADTIVRRLFEAARQDEACASLVPSLEAVWDAGEWTAPQLVERLTCPADEGART